MISLASGSPAWIAGGLTLLLSAVTGWQGYQLYQEARSPEVQAPALAPTSAPAAVTPQALPPALFGRAGVVEEEVVEESHEDLPDTNLRLVLRGVSAQERNSGQRTAQGGALIEGPDRQTNFYRVGESLPGAATLHEVYANRVILSRSGKLENLPFPEGHEDNFVTIYDPEEQEGDFFDEEEEYSDGYEEEVFEEEAYSEESYVDGEEEQVEVNLDGDADTQARLLESQRRAQIQERLRQLREKIQERSGG